jgi:two-component sensor histidine kinase
MPTNARECRLNSPAKPDIWLYLDEITHRTLNDYSIMLAMIRRASSLADQATGLAILDVVAKRLEAGAIAVGALRPSRGSQFRNLDEDLELLCSSLSASVLADRGIRLTLSAEPVLMEAYRSWQVSLIVSELITNVAKHAFHQLSSGTMLVEARIDGETLSIVVSDDGKAPPRSLPGRGSGIIDALVDDLGGSIVRSYSENGTSVRIRVPMF